MNFEQVFDSFISDQATSSPIWPTRQRIRIANLAEGLRTGNALTTQMEVSLPVMTPCHQNKNTRVLSPGADPSEVSQLVQMHQAADPLAGSATGHGQQQV